MFDLFRRRDKAMRYLLTGLLGLIAVSMVITLIPGYGTPSASSENIIAQVGGEPITLLEVQNQLQAVLRRQQIPQQMMQFYVPQFVDQMITERAIAYQAKRMGFEVTDEELAQAIRSALNSAFPGGKIDPEGYRMWVAQQNMTVPQFEDNFRKNLLLLKLQNIALEGSLVPPQEIKDEFHRRNDKIKVEYVAFSPVKFRDSAIVTREEALDYYNKNRAQFRTPERRSFHLLIADENKTGQSIDVTDGLLRRTYQDNIERYRLPERVKARHILIKTMEKPANEAGALEAKTNDLLKQIRGGADFAELAKKHSDDTGSAVKGGDLDWVVRGQTVPEFEKTLFSLKPKEVSGVVKTQYGYHIIQALEKENARVRPFEEVKEELVAETKRRAVFERMQDSMDKARADLLKNANNAPQIANQYGLIYVRAEKIGPGDPVPEVGTNAELQASIQSARAGEITPIMQLAPNRLGVAVVTSIEAPRQAEFAEMEAQVMSGLRMEKANAIAREKTDEATRKFKAAGSDLKAAAAAVGAEVKTTDYITAEGNIEGLGAASSFADLFSRPVGSVYGPITAQDNVVLAKLVDKQAADESALSANREKILLELKRRRAQERKELFEEGLIAQLTKQGKITKYPEVIKRLTSSSFGG
ncbi:MAG TPA: peptidylprolyl isomerase [Bryobacteraceae bacterium]|nr:peptidylprolyl isomerase [Bryobacteraceae bacterium]